jgi:hypothetical protein
MNPDTSTYLMVYEVGVRRSRKGRLGGALATSLSSALFIKAKYLIERGAHCCCFLDLTSGCV